MRTDALPRETVKPYHSNLDVYQRFILNNPKTSLRNRMSDLSSLDRPATRSRNSSSRGNKKNAALTQDLSHESGMDDHAQSSDEGGVSKSDRPPRLAPIPSNKNNGTPSHISEGWGGSSQRDALEQGDDGYPADPRDAAGYAELQAAFERAYDKMLRDPPPSIIDTVITLVSEMKFDCRSGRILAKHPGVVLDMSLIAGPVIIMETKPKEVS